MYKPELAMFGDTPYRTEPFPSINTFDYREEEAVARVMSNGRLSGYRGAWCSEFYGGIEIKRLERSWAKRFGARHAIACNSATSGLHVACGAIQLQAGDEVIVSPYSMTCSATAPMVYGATPIFADVEQDYYCIDPVSVEARITESTKAIIAVSIFGQPYDPKINEIAKKHGLYVIEDAAQAIGSVRKEPIYKQKEKLGEKSIYAGMNGDIGVFSFNYGKHITCGEGGMIVTDNDDLAMKCRLIMNHAEAVVNGMPHNTNMRKYTKLVGFNMRMTELQAAIISEQLKKLSDLIDQRRNNVSILNERLSKIPAITPSKIRPDCTHSYYVCSFQWDKKQADGIPRNVFIEAVKKELPPRIGRENEDCQIGCGYVKPIYLMPLFDRPNIANYEPGSCPVAEKLWREDLFLTLYHSPNSTVEDMEDVCGAFEKVWTHRQQLTSRLDR